MKINVYEERNGSGNGSVSMSRTVHISTVFMAMGSAGPIHRN